MIDIYDTEALVNVYRMLDKKCSAIDMFINIMLYILDHVQPSMVL